MRLLVAAAGHDLHEVRNHANLPVRPTWPLRLLRGARACQRPPRVAAGRRRKRADQRHTRPARRVGTADLSRHPRPYAHLVGRRRTSRTGVQRARRGDPARHLRRHRRSSAAHPAPLRVQHHLSARRAEARQQPRRLVVARHLRLAVLPGEPDRDGAEPGRQRRPARRGDGGARARHEGGGRRDPPPQPARPRCTGVVPRALLRRCRQPGAARVDRRPLRELGRWGAVQLPPPGGVGVACRRGAYPGGAVRRRRRALRYRPRPAGGDEAQQRLHPALRTALRRGPGGGHHRGQRARGRPLHHHRLLRFRVPRSDRQSAALPAGARTGAGRRRRRQDVLAVPRRILLGPRTVPEPARGGALQLRAVQDLRAGRAGHLAGERDLPPVRGPLPARAGARHRADGHARQPRRTAPGEHLRTRQPASSADADLVPDQSAAGLRGQRRGRSVEGVRRQRVRRLEPFRQCGGPQRGAGVQRGVRIPPPQPGARHPGADRPRAGGGGDQAGAARPVAGGVQLLRRQRHRERRSAHGAGDRRGGALRGGRPHLLAGDARLRALHGTRAARDTADYLGELPAAGKAAAHRSGRRGLLRERVVARFLRPVAGGPFPRTGRGLLRLPGGGGRRGEPRPAAAVSR